MSGPTPSPQLLVSVRSLEEARIALAGGADVIDIKEPDRGSLGRALPEVIESVGSLPGLGTSARPLSVALGEVREALSDRSLRRPPDLSLRPDLCLPSNITFAKLGLSHLRDDPAWVARWVRAREHFGANRREKLKWIGVIYADAETAQALPAIEVIDGAASTGCWGLLVDTYCKRNGRLLDHATPADLARWARLAHAARLKFAVAGRLSAEDLPRIISVGVDIVAVRTAVCRGGERGGMLCADAVAKFKRAVRRTAADAQRGAATGGVAAARPGG